MVNIDLEKIRREMAESRSRLFERTGAGELKERIDKCTEKLSRIRGDILHRSIEIEMILNNFLETYFTFDPKDMDYEKSSHFWYLLDKLTFQKRIDIFRKINFHNKKKFDDRYKGLEKILDSIRESRNMVAHSIQVHFTEPMISKRGKKIELDEKYSKRFNENADIAMIALVELILEVREGDWTKTYNAADQL